MSEIVRIERTKNFTVMGNIHLLDSTLSLKAKGLMSLVLQFPEKWNYSIKGLMHFAKDKRDSFSSTLKELENSGYLNRYRERSEKGQLKGMHYTFYENPGDNPEFMKKKENADKPVKAKCTNKSIKTSHNAQNTISEQNPLLTEMIENASNSSFKHIETAKREPVTDFPKQAFPMQEKPSLSNINRNKKDNYLSDQNDQKRSFFFGDDDLKTKMGYSSLVKHYPESQVNEIFSVLSDLFKLQRDVVRVNSRNTATEKVKHELSQLHEEHISYAIDCLQKRTDIRSRRAYILTTLYNARSGYENYSFFKPPETRNSSHMENSGAYYDTKPSYDLDEFEQFALNFSLFGNG